MNRLPTVVRPISVANQLPTPPPNKHAEQCPFTSREYHEDAHTRGSRARLGISEPMTTSQGQPEVALLAPCQLLVELGRLVEDGGPLDGSRFGEATERESVRRGDESASADRVGLTELGPALLYEGQLSRLFGGREVGALLDPQCEGGPDRPTWSWFGDGPEFGDEMVGGGAVGSVDGGDPIETVVFECGAEDLEMVGLRGVVGERTGSAAEVVEAVGQRVPVEGRVEDGLRTVTVATVVDACDLVASPLIRALRLLVIPGAGLRSGQVSAGRTEVVLGRGECCSGAFFCVDRLSMGVPGVAP